jgi:hypothetical protein
MDMEEILRLLMVSNRAKIENGKKVNRQEILQMLDKVNTHGQNSGDIRFLDCVTYFEELGFSLLEGELQL